MSSQSTLHYRRSESDWIAANHDDRSLTYWRSQARDIFFGYPTVDLVEIIRSGRKTDSELLRRGDGYAAPGQYVIIASTGGRWGRCRQDYRPC